MAVTVNYYLNGPSLSTATGIFTDVDLTICAPDGWYSDGIISKQLVGCKLLTQQTCSGCIENTIKLQYNATSAYNLFCVTSTNVDVFMALGDVFSSTTQIYTDATLTTPVADGFYKEKFSSFYREELAGSLGVLQTGPSCPPVSGFYRSGASATCSTFCTTNYNISAGVSTLSGNDYFNLTFGDEISGGLADGFYAYYFETTTTSAPVNGWRIMEIQNNLVDDILVCDAGNNCVNP